MRFIEQEKLNSMWAGSLEQLSGVISSAASEKMEDDVSIFATHQSSKVVNLGVASGFAFGVCGGSVVRVEWKVEDGEMKVECSEVDGCVISESNVDEHVSSTVRDAVRAMCSDDFDDEAWRTRLHGLAKLAVEDGDYWASDSLNEASEMLSEEPEWLGQYEANRESIRKSLHGTLGVTESRVPKTRYGSIRAARIEDFRPEIYDSAKIVIERLSEAASAVEGLVFDKDQAHGVFLDSARDSIVKQAQSLARLGERVLRLSREEDLQSVAGLHDLLAERAKAMLIVGKLLSRSSEPSNTHGDQ